MSEKCGYCGDFYKRITRHWNLNDACDPPPLNEKQEKIIKGFLMGDGDVQCFNGKTLIRFRNTNKRFLEWVHEVLQPFSNELRLIRTGEDISQKYPDRYEEVPQDYYGFTLKSVPEIKKFSGWYDSGSKRFPKDLNLTPHTAKMWYCTDGGLDWHSSEKVCYSAIFGISNESSRVEYLKSLFEKKGFDVSVYSKTLRLSSQQLGNFLNWLGEAPPGMEYKWETDSLNNYREKKKEAMQA